MTDAMDDIAIYLDSRTLAAPAPRVVSCRICGAILYEGPISAETITVALCHGPDSLRITDTSFGPCEFTVSLEDGEAAEDVERQ